MNLAQQRKALAAAVASARAAGALIRQNQWSAKKVNAQSQRDIKLELDVRSQKLIEKNLLAAFPDIAFLGEEDDKNDAEAPYRWVVDPIDGTINFAYGIPHACVSIALQQQIAQTAPGLAPGAPLPDSCYQTIVAAIYDPFCEEMWTALRGQPARLNGRPIRVSTRRKLEEAIIIMGFSKTQGSMEAMLGHFARLLPRIRKVRIFGSAALGLAWIAAGRLDAYKEYGVQLWDIAAGALLIECAGGEFWHRLMDGRHGYEIMASNGLLRKPIEKVCAGK